MIDPDRYSPNGESPSFQWHQSLMQHIQNVKRSRGGTLNADVLDLVQCMLRWDPKDRPTATQILAHPFFTSDHPCFDGTNAQPPVITPCKPFQPQTQLTPQQLPPPIPETSRGSDQPNNQLFNPFFPRIQAARATIHQCLHHTAGDR